MSMAIQCMAQGSRTISLNSSSDDSLQVFMEHAECQHSVPIILATTNLQGGLAAAYICDVFWTFAGFVFPQKLLTSSPIWRGNK